MAANPRKPSHLRKHLRNQASATHLKQGHFGRTKAQCKIFSLPKQFHLPNRCGPQLPGLRGSVHVAASKGMAWPAAIAGM